MPPPEHGEVGRVSRIVDAVRAHARAIEEGPRGTVRVSWSNGDVTCVVEVHYAKEPKRTRDESEGESGQ